MPTSTGVNIIGGSYSVMPHNEADLHKGYVWRGADRTQVASGASRSFIVEPCGIADPETKLNSWFVWSIYSPGSSLLVEIFKSPDEITGGSALALFNGIICLETSPLLVIKKGATVGVDGTFMDAIESGAAKNPSPIPEQEEWQCRSLKTHIKATNLDNSAQYITTRFRVVEHG